MNIYILFHQKEHLKKNDGHPFLIKIKNFDHKNLTDNDLNLTKEVLDLEDDIMIEIEKKGSNDSANNVFAFFDLVFKLGTA